MADNTEQQEGNVSVQFNLLVTLMMNSSNELSLDANQTFRTRLRVPAILGEWLQKHDTTEKILHIEPPHTDFNPEDTAIVFLVDNWRRSLEKYNNEKVRQAKDAAVGAKRRAIIEALAAKIRIKLRGLEAELGPAHAYNMAEEIVTEYKVGDAKCFGIDLTAMSEEECRVKYVGSYYQQYVATRKD